MQFKKPVNPRGDSGSADIDTSGPRSPGAGELDPTIAYISGDSGIGGGSINTFKLNGGFLEDPVDPMLAPEQPNGPPRSSLSRAR